MANAETSESNAESSALAPKRKPGNPAWVKGMKALPKKGLPKQTLEEIWQDPGPRAKKLMQKHGIMTIMKACDDPKFASKNFSSYDQMILAAINNAMRGNGEERERLFNRIFGKVPDKTISLNFNVDVSASALSARASALLTKIGGETIESDS